MCCSILPVEKYINKNFRRVSPFLKKIDASCHIPPEHNTNKSSVRSNSNEGSLNGHIRRVSMTNRVSMNVNTNQGRLGAENTSLESVFLKEIEQSKQQLLRICSAYANDDEEKKDLFQEVLVNIWKSMPSFKGNSAFSTWMYRVTLNVCISTKTKITKKKKQFINMDSVKLAQYQKPPDGVEEESPMLLYLRSCIKEMNESNKAVITLYLEELPYKEIAAITGLTENNVAVKVKRIKKRLLNCIKGKS